MPAPWDSRPGLARIECGRLGRTSPGAVPSMDKRSAQRIRYFRTQDGLRLAWAEAGEGPVLVKAANWLTHLEYELRSPVWKHWIEFLSSHFRLVRYDERGCGMSEQPSDRDILPYAADASTRAGRTSRRTNACRFRRRRPWACSPRACRGERCP